SKTVKPTKTNGRMKRMAAPNSRLPQVAVTCKIESLCFCSASVQVDSLVLQTLRSGQVRNPAERKARKRYR
ncbi:MAG: hypothetical protein ABIK31_06270, partial [candidate division WOR-3 bacterium]